MDLWVSAAAAVVPATLAAALSLRPVNRGSARRFRAAFIDLAIAGVVVGLAWGAVALLMEISGSGRARLGLDVASALGLVLAGVFMLLRDDLPLQPSGARSPGKAHQHLRVARRDSTSMTPAVSIARNLPLAAVPLLAVPAAAPLAAVVLVTEILLVWLHPRGLRIGDRIAGTRVMFRSRARSHSRAVHGHAAETTLPDF